MALQHCAQQLGGVAHVFFTVVGNDVAPILLPTALPDVLGNRPLVDTLPAFDTVGAASVGQAFAGFLARLVRIMR